MRPRPVAALYVESGGPYCGVDGVDPWTERRDARQYFGPDPVVAHPPCKRWGRYWGGGPSVKVPRRMGDDGGCFASALYAVRLFGGVLEHPEASHAWRWHGLRRPPRGGGWVDAGDGLGVTCCVEQGHYGHRARKATWLYAARVVVPELTWGASQGDRFDEGFHSPQERRAARQAGQAPRKRLSAAERLHTPAPFRDLLVSIARTASIDIDSRALCGAVSPSLDLFG